mmetsp:Transcript_33569/g.73962  ORF Transcript_33569/g.73962 Transcript_33569/m.73962 type:complete len:398 (+) Transcript_33569:180-1373(+)
MTSSDEFRKFLSSPWLTVSLAVITICLLGTGGSVPSASSPVQHVDVSDVTSTSSPNTSTSTAIGAGVNASAISSVDACSEDALADLRAVLRNDPESVGLRPITVSGVTFAGLDDTLLSESFRGHQIAFLGDSTLYHLNRWIHTLLLATDSSTLSNLSSMDLSAANTILRPVEENLDFHITKTIISADGTFIRFTGIVGVGGLCNFGTHWRRIRMYPPKVLVANFGLHWLHFTGQGWNAEVCDVMRWIKYEEWLEETLRAAEKVGAETLLFKTTNLICAEKYDGEYAQGNKLYMARDKDTLDSCFNDVRGSIPAEVEDDRIWSYCYNGTFNEIGAAHLNQRLVEFVMARRNTTKLKVGIFNDHDIESCSYTGELDGRHYHALNLVRIRLLGNVLKCFL